MYVCLCECAVCHCLGTYTLLFFVCHFTRFVNAFESIGVGERVLFSSGVISTNNCRQHQRVTHPYTPAYVSFFLFLLIDMKAISSKFVCK